MANYVDADRLRAEIDRRMTENCELAEKAGGAFGQRAVEDNDILALIDSLQQEQPQVADASKMDLAVDLEKELYDYISSGEYLNTRGNGSLLVARHFYGLRNRALEEAARHVYESWMGGTMDHVRRDMVTLGKVLNARKEDK